MKNIKTCLEAAGSSTAKIVRRRMYFMNIKKDIKTVMDVWDRYGTSNGRLCCSVS